MISYDLSGMVVLVTGGSRGIGYAIAKKYAEAGATVAILSKNGNKAKEAAEKLNSHGLKSIGMGIDMSKGDQASQAPKYVVEKFGKIDVLVNNAAVDLRMPALEVDEDIWNTTLDTNLKGMFFCAQSAGREMIKRKTGSIINIASIQSVVAQIGQAPYGASKAGIMMMTKVLALEWGPYNVRVNAIAPGSIKTDMNEEFLSKKENMQKNLSKIPLGRIGDPDDIAGITVFLSTNDAAYITGSLIIVDGGWTLE